MIQIARKRCAKGVSIAAENEPARLPRSYLRRMRLWPVLLAVALLIVVGSHSSATAEPSAVRLGAPSVGGICVGDRQVSTICKGGVLQATFAPRGTARLTLTYRVRCLSTGCSDPLLPLEQPLTLYQWEGSTRVAVRPAYPQWQKQLVGATAYPNGVTMRTYTGHATVRVPALGCGKHTLYYQLNQVAGPDPIRANTVWMVSTPETSRWEVSSC